MDDGTRQREDDEGAGITGGTTEEKPSMARTELSTVAGDEASSIKDDGLGNLMYAHPKPKRAYHSSIEPLLGIRGDYNSITVAQGIFIDPNLVMFDGPLGKMKKRR